MATKVIENYSECGIKVEKIVKRILKYAPPNSIDGLDEVLILDKDPAGKGFARYLKDKHKIELFVHDIIGWQPWLLKKSYLFPYLAIGIALGHEIDHHVNRKETKANEEKSAETNALKYVYPSLGIFKPIVRLLAFLFKRNNTS